MKTFKYRLYPTAAQADELNRQLTEGCRLYNAAVQERRDAWRLRGEHIGYYHQSKQLTEIRAAGDIAIPDCKVARDVLRRVDLAFQAFFRRVKRGETPGYPRFRSWRRFDSLTFTAGGKTHWIENRRVSLHGIGNVRLNLHRPIEGKVKTVTVKRSADRWFVYFSCDVGVQVLPQSGATVGVDLGLESFAVLSTGEVVESPRCGRAAHAAVRLAQRRVARRKLGSSGRRKAVMLLARAREHEANQRRDFHHKVASSLINRFDLIAVEDLNVKGLARTILAKPIHDAGWGQFLRILSAKAENAGRVVVAVNPAGTSQKCSDCGEFVPKTLNERWHDCPACGFSASRDHNAALNILRAGMARAALTDTDDRPVAAEANA